MRRARILAPVALLAAALLIGCSDDGEDGGDDGGDRAAAIAALIESGEVSADGEDLYGRSCASCHGRDGQGGVGPQIAGVVAEKYTPQDHASLVLSGRNAMPSFANLSDDELAAILTYERTELGD